MRSAPAAAPIPIAVITGFLGSGKTTLLRQILRFPELSNAAVLINEFGEIGLDHYLVQHIDENVVMLASGCVCCTIRDDLGKALRDLLHRRASSEIPPFDRVIVETTGLADPVPILHTLMTEPVVDKAFRIHRIIATVDAVNGETHLARQPESVKQVALADRIVVTKTDLVTLHRHAALKARLGCLNPLASIVTVPSQDFRPDGLFGGVDYFLSETSTNARAWLADESLHASSAVTDVHTHLDPLRDVNRHDEHIAACCLVLEESIDWPAFCVWLTMLLHSRGADALRVKGILNVAGRTGPVFVNGVQHIVHPPIHLDGWHDQDQRSRLVLITRNIPREALQASLSAFNRTARTIHTLDGDHSGEVVAMGAGHQIGGRPFRRSGGLSWMK